MRLHSSIQTKARPRSVVTNASSVKHSLKKKTNAKHESDKVNKRNRI